MGLICVVVLFLADVTEEVEPEKLPEVTPVDVPPLLAPPKEPEEKGGGPEEEGEGAPRNELSLGAVLSGEKGAGNTYALDCRHFLGKKFLERGEPPDLAPFLQKCGLIRILLESEVQPSLDPPATWALSSLREGGEGAFQFRFALFASQDSWSPTYVYEVAAGAGASLYLGPYLKLGYLYRYARDMEEFQYAFDEGRYADSNSHLVDVGLALRAGKQYFMLEGELESGSGGSFAKPKTWLGLLTYYPVSAFSLSVQYAEEGDSEELGAGFSADLGSSLGLSLMWKAIEGEAPRYETRIHFRF